MARYIDADKLLEYLEKEAESEDVKYSYIGAGVQATINEIKKFPLEDVKPVTHAHWNFHYYDSGYKASMTCTACGGSMDSDAMDISHYVYCPCCGAKMDEEVDNDTI